MSTYGNYEDYLEHRQLQEAIQDFSDECEAHLDTLCRCSKCSLTSWDVEQLGRMAAGGNPNAGQIVETKTGLTGRTYNKDTPVNGKVLVYCTGGAKMLCDPATLKIKGYID